MKKIQEIDWMRKCVFIFSVIILIASFPVVSAEDISSASRIIENSNLSTGGSTNVTITIINNNNSHAMSLMEIVPDGWTLTRISDDTDAFKSTTNEWVWFNVGPGDTETVIYELNVPSTAVLGIYNIAGEIIDSSGVQTPLSGQNMLLVTLPLNFNISGYEIYDLNANGIWDIEEQGIANWNITIHNANTGAKINETSTNSAGFYQFQNLAQGSYIVSEEEKAEWNHTNATFILVALNSNFENANFTNNLHSGAAPPVGDCGVDKIKCENVGAPAQFNGSASFDSDGTIISYYWDFGDGTKATVAAPKHMYASYKWNGTAYEPYIVNLTVTDEIGLTNSTSQKTVIWMTGDANGDGNVNILDASVVGLKWGGNDACADLNNDGSVNILDASMIGLNWGKIA